jgi:mannose-6-phosphate isomerase
VEHFGARLPYLLKILAAERALSIQVHPSREQARAGFAAEDAAGVDRAAPDRNYRDDNHKPELICALTTFEALCGFRPVAATLALLDRLAVPELGFLRELLTGPDPLRAAMAGLLDHPDPRPVLAALAGRLAAGGDPAFDGVRLAAADYPDDVGVLLALLLNHVRLEPGEAIFLPAGNVHAYLRGLGVEIMANSDNVLRCGLTSKHVDVPAVLAVTDFTALAEPRWPSLRGSFDVPVPDFRLVRLVLDEPTGLDDVGPLIVLCTQGAVEVGGLELAPGRAAFVPAAEAVTVAGSGVAFVAGVGTLGGSDRVSKVRVRTGEQ